MRHKDQGPDYVGQFLGGAAVIIVIVVIVAVLYSVTKSDAKPTPSYCSVDPGYCEPDHEQYENLPMGG